MAQRNVIKEYLVSLGFNLDETSVAAVRRGIQSSASSVVSSMNLFNGSLKRGLAAYITFITAANIGIAEFVSSVADADLELQINANRMWMNAEAYMHMENAAKSLGYTMQDLSSIARSPELTQRFRELTQLSQNVSAPQELEGMLRQVRDITFEFDRLKVIGRNGIRQIVYYFLQYLGVGLDEIQYKLHYFVEYVRVNLPKIAATIARVLYTIWQLGSALMHVFGVIGRIIASVFRFFKEFPTAFKIFVTAISIILFAMNPALSLILGGLTTLLLLVDDFVGWQQGKNSHFGDKWQVAVDTFTKVQRKIKEIVEFLMPAIEFIVNIVKLIFSIIKMIANVIRTIINILYPFLRLAHGIIKGILTIIQIIANIIYDIIKTVKPFMDWLLDGLQSIVDKINAVLGVFNKKLSQENKKLGEDTDVTYDAILDNAKRISKDSGMSDLIRNMFMSNSGINTGISAFSYFKGLLDNIVVPSQKRQNENSNQENRNKSDNKAINFVQNLNINGVKGAYESTEQIKKYTERMLRNMSTSSVTR